MPEAKAAPFLRWAGGKRQLLDTLLNRVPRRIEGRYIEPFLGAGSLFFALAPQDAILADKNAYLIDTFRQIATNPEVVRRALLEHIRLHSFDHYYETRDKYNLGAYSAAQAARFLYLNRTCFNGIFRVNTKGKFNVPKGSKDRLSRPSKRQFYLIAECLRNAELIACDFAAVLAQAQENDFVYLDPPYPALNDTAFFAHYTADRFDTASQERLAECVRGLDNGGTQFLLSNADDPSIRKLYRGFRIESVPVIRYVTCKGSRTAVSELLIRNY